MVGKADHASRTARDAVGIVGKVDRVIIRGMDHAGLDCCPRLATIGRFIDVAIRASQPDIPAVEHPQSTATCSAMSHGSATDAYYRPGSAVIVGVCDLTLHRAGSLAAGDEAGSRAPHVDATHCHH